MLYTFEAFVADCRSHLAQDRQIVASLALMSEALSRLLGNADFVAATFASADFNKKLLYRDPVTDMRVLAHIHHGPKEGAPHSHGASWAIYGTAFGVTGMKEWRRVNHDADAGSVLELAGRYDLETGQARAFGPHAVHSTIHPATAWVIRVTGADLDAMPRYRFDRRVDRLSGPPS